MGHPAMLGGLMGVFFDFRFKKAEETNQNFLVRLADDV